jgi:hypothetical protein
MNKNLKTRFLPTLSNTVYRDKMAIADAVVSTTQQPFQLFPLHNIT